MSRAFIKETDTVEPLPERAVSPHPNYVTSRGLALIDAEVARLSLAYARAQEQASDGGEAVARIGRDLRYWQQRRASAQRVAPPADRDSVHFGSVVTILRDDQRRQVWRIVGEDEADPAHGTLSYVAPVARALMGKRVGDMADVGHTEAEIVAIAAYGDDEPR